MRLYSGADPMMKPMLAELISKLHDSSGRTEVIKKIDACHEAAGDAVSAERKQDNGHADRRLLFGCWIT
eukprot:7054515-Prymnesium_polylepis.1